MLFNKWQTPEELYSTFIKSGLSPKEFAEEYGINHNTLRGALIRAKGETARTAVSEKQLQKFVALARQATELMDEIDPVIISAERHIITDCPIAVLMAGCMHLGGRWTQYEIIQEVINRLLHSERTYLGLFGDEIENFLPGFPDMRAVLDQAISPKIQVAAFKAFFRIIEDSILFGMDSQHGGQWFTKKSSVHPLKEMYVERGIPYFDGQGMFTLKVGSEESPQIYRLAVAHGFPGYSMYNPLHPHDRARKDKFPSADLIAQADKHTYSFSERRIYEFEYREELRPTPYVHYVQIGTAKTGNDPYTLKSWANGEGVYPIAVFWPDRHLIKVTRHWTDALYWIGESNGEKEPAPLRP